MNNECVFNWGRKCTALTQKNCESCRFRKTREELEAGRQRAQERVNSLPEDQQAHIRRKYNQKQEEEW